MGDKGEDTGLIPRFLSLPLCLLGLHGTLHSPGARGRQVMGALVCIPSPVKWWWGMQGQKEGAQRRLAWAKAHSGNRMACGNESRIEISFPGYWIPGGGRRTTQLKSITGSSEPQDFSKLRDPYEERSRLFIPTKGSKSLGQVLVAFHNFNLFPPQILEGIERGRNNDG